MITTRVRVARTLLAETIGALAENGRTPDNVRWCGSCEFGWFTWQEFAAVADVDYERGLLTPKVAEDLVIVGADFWLDRGDEPEQWRYHIMPAMPYERRSPERVVAATLYGATLAELHETVSA